MNKNKIEIVICDFDNTLFDWFNYWYKSFSILINNIVKHSNLDKETLLNEIRKVHQKHRTSEYNRLLDELNILKETMSESELEKLYSLILPPYFEYRKRELRLYPNVLDTLTTMKNNGLKVVIYTESQPIYSFYRLSALGLTEVVDALYAPKSHENDNGNSLYFKYDTEIASFQNNSKLIELPKEDKKPNPKVLFDIIKDNISTSDKAIFIGDSIMKDICMANEAKVISVFADYGVKHHKVEYELLKRVSHWTDEDVLKEKEFTRETCVPNYSIKNFGEILSIIKNLEN